MILEAIDLGRNFGPLQAVKNVHLQIKPKEIFGLVGPDGAGKTTAMRLFSGILDPSYGTLRVLGYTLPDQAEALKRHIGYMSQRFGLYPDLTVQENIDFYSDLYEIFDPTRQEKLLRISQLLPFCHRQAQFLSGGMKQKLALCCAMLHSPPLVLLDEPTNGVDPISRREFWTLLKDLQEEGCTVLMSTSYLDEAQRCDRIGLMHEGKIFALGTLEELKKKIKTKILQLEIDNCRPWLALFEETFGSKARLFGHSMHIETDEPHKVLEQVKKLACEKQIPLISAQQIEPSLEDIFIALTGA